MALEIIHTDRSYTVIDNEQGHWSSQSLYNSYLNARKFALAWKAAAKFWRWHCRTTIDYVISRLQEASDESQD